MDEYAKELVAIGAAAAVNCRPCLEYHWRKGRQAGVTITEALHAAEVGLSVNRGAAAQTKGYVSEVISGDERPEEAGQESGCGCGD